MMKALAEYYQAWIDITDDSEASYNEEDNCIDKASL